MSKKIEITGNVRVWISDTWRTVKDIEKQAQDNPDQAVGSMTYTGPNQDLSEYGWIEVGTAIITATLLENDEVNAKQVENLKAQIQEIQADAQKKVRVLEDRIQSLLAITYEGPTNE